MTGAEAARRTSRAALTWCGFWAGGLAGLSVLSAWWWLTVAVPLCGALAAVATAGRRWAARGAVVRPGGDR